MLQTMQIRHSHSYHVTFELVVFALQLFGCQYRPTTLDKELGKDGAGAL